MVQTISYLPHFLSWVVVASLIRPLVASSGPLNLLAAALGVETPILFLQRPGTFLAIVLVSDIWKGVGWGSIIYLAAISGIDPSLYESAEISKIMGRRNGWLTELRVEEGLTISDINRKPVRQPGGAGCCTLHRSAHGILVCEHGDLLPRSGHRRVE